MFVEIIPSHGRLTAQHTSSWCLWEFVDFDYADMSSAILHLLAIAFWLILIKLTDKNKKIHKYRTTNIGLWNQFLRLFSELYLMEIQTGERVGFHLIPAEFGSDLSPM